MSKSQIEGKIGDSSHHRQSHYLQENEPNERVMPIDENGLIVLCGPSLSGKTSFAKRWFRESELIALEKISSLLHPGSSPDESDPQARELLSSLVRQRLKANLLTVVDSKSLDSSFRRELVQLSREYQVTSYLLIMDFSPEEYLERYQSASRELDSVQIELEIYLTELASRSAYYEGFNAVYRWSQFGGQGPLPLRKPLPIRKELSGPFDIIGDIHGCYDELIALLRRMGYLNDLGSPSWYHPEGRLAVFLGDLADRGPHSLAVIELVISMVESGNALYLPGNHCEKLARYFYGSKVSVEHGLETTVQELEILDAPTKESFARRFLKLYGEAPPYLLLDSDRLLVAHAGLPEKYHGRLSMRIKSFAIYGELTGELDAYGRPIRYNWSLHYSGRPLVVYGHTPNLYPRFINNSINIDQGCVFGGALTALRYPEREIISIPAKYIYWHP